MQQYIFKITENLAGSRLDIASTSLCDFSRSRIQQLIKNGDVILNGYPQTDQKLKVQEGDKIVINAPIPIDTIMRPCDIELNVVYQDEHLMVIDKQAGLTVHPGAGQHGDTLANALMKYCGENLSDIGGSDRPGIVHRLDRETSGLMVVAKNNAAHLSLAGQIASRNLKRVYKAIVWGRIAPPLGIISTNLELSHRDRTRMQIVKHGGKIAITHYRTVEMYDHTSLVECSLDTGRTHQIRVHMTYIGHPVFGDPVYGSHLNKMNQYYKGQEFISDFKRQALHSCCIEFTHPVTNEIMNFTSELPKDIEDARMVLQRTYVKA